MSSPDEGLTFRAALGLTAVALALIFVVQNNGSGRVSFLLWDLELPAWLWMLLLFGAGVVAGAVLPRLRDRACH